MKRLVITGAGGFIGRNLVEFLADDYEIVAIDKFGEISHQLEDLVPFCKDIIKADLSSPSFIKSLTSLFEKADLVAHLAAISHVDDSLQFPTETIRNNVMAGANVIETCHQIKAPLLSLSTDETLGPFAEGYYGEINGKLRPSSPYSSSKAAVDLIAESYKTTFNTDITTVRMTNVYGQHQHVQKMIPKTISALLAEKPVEVFGKGLQKRNWLYIDDACRYFKFVIDELVSSSYRRCPIYHFDGFNEIDNLSLVFKIAEFMEVNPTIKFIDDRKGHDYRYALEPNKGFVDCLANQRILPLPSTKLDEGLRLTIEHYKEKLNGKD